MIHSRFVALSVSLTRKVSLQQTVNRIDHVRALRSSGGFPHAWQAQKTRIKLAHSVAFALQEAAEAQRQQRLGQRCVGRKVEPEPEPEPDSDGLPAEWVKMEAGGAGGPTVGWGAPPAPSTQTTRVPSRRQAEAAAAMRRRAGIVSKEEQEAQAQAERLGKGPVQAPTIWLDYFTEDLIYDPEAGRFDPPPSGRPQAHTVVPIVAASTVFGHPRSSQVFVPAKNDGSEGASEVPPWRQDAWEVMADAAVAKTIHVRLTSPEPTPQPPSDARKLRTAAKGPRKMKPTPSQPPLTASDPAHGMQAGRVECWCDARAAGAGRRRSASTSLRLLVAAREGREERGCHRALGKKSSRRGWTRRSRRCTGASASAKGERRREAARTCNHKCVGGLSRAHSCLLAVASRSPKACDR